MQKTRSRNSLEAGVEPLRTTRWVAEYIGCTSRSVIHYRTKGLPFFYIGKLVRYRQSEVDAWLEEQRNKQSAA